MMRVHPLIPVGLLVSMLGIPSITSADPIYLSVQRFVSVFNVADPQAVRELGLGPLDVEVSGAGAVGSARATQSSTIGPEGIAGSGTSEAQRIGILSPGAQTSLSATFMLATAHPFLLDATVFHSGVGVDLVRLFSFTTRTFLLDHETFDPGSHGFSRSGVLPPGTYNFAVAVGSFDGSAGFNGQLALEAAPTPEPGTLLLVGVGVASALTRRRRSDDGDPPSTMR